MSEKAVVKNAFGALNKKKKKKGDKDANNGSATSDIISEKVANFNVSDNWADEDDGANDGFYDDGFAAPTKSMKTFKAQPNQFGTPEEVVSESEEEEDEETESEEEEAEEQPTESPSKIDPVKTAKPNIRKENKPKKESVEDIDALLEELGVQDEKSAAKETFQTPTKSNGLSEEEKAAQEALNSLLSSNDQTDSGKSKKKKKNKGKKKKTENESPNANGGDDDVDGREAALKAINNIKKKKGQSAGNAARKVVEAEEKARMEKLKKKKDKSKFNQIPAHLLN